MARSRRRKPPSLPHPSPSPSPEPKPKPTQPGTPLQTSPPKPKHPHLIFKLKPKHSGPESKPKPKPTRPGTPLQTPPPKPKHPQPIFKLKPKHSGPESEPKPKPDLKPQPDSEHSGPEAPTPKPGVWRKSDVVVIMKGMVDFVAQKGVDPTHHLDDFVDFVNTNSTAYNEIWKQYNEGGLVADKVSTLGTNNVSETTKKKNPKINVGGVGCLSVPTYVKKSSVEKNSVVCGEKEKLKSKSISNCGGEECTTADKDLKKKKVKVNNVGVQKSRSRGGVGRRRMMMNMKTMIFGSKKASVKPKKSGMNVCGESSGFLSKGGGMKNNNVGCSNLDGFGFRDENEGVFREAVRRMISRRLSLRDELQTDLSWCPPKIGVLKWNTDASLREDYRMTAIGGVLRDWQGSFRCVFSCPVGCCDVNEAEVRAIYKALELASCKDWLLSLTMVIESDSMNAVSWCNEDSGGPLSLGYMLSYIRECRRWWPGLEITYMGRKSNSVADRLAKQGHQRSADFVAWM